MWKTNQTARKRERGDAMPISQTVYRKCAMCGKTYPVRVGDVIRLRDMLPYICNKCAGFEYYKKLP